MSNIYRKNGSERSSTKLPQHGREPQHEEYGREHEGATMCPECRNVHYKKKWYDEHDVAIGRLREGGEIIEGRELCPACKMIRNHLFEGEVFIENVPDRYREELLNLVRGFGKRALLDDPQDRIIQVARHDGGYRVTTTEDQLAVRLAKKIEDTFDVADIRISYAAEPQEVSRIHVTFGGK